MKKIIKFNFDGFYCLLNTENSKSLYIPYEYGAMEEEIISGNDFSSVPVQGNMSDTLTICINLTSDCNMNCLYCFNKNKTNKSPSFEKISEFIIFMLDKFSSVDKVFLDLSGSGEPLLQINKIIQIADLCESLQDKYEKEIQINFICNGTLLTRKNVELLQSHNIIFGISLDGIKEYHDKNRIFKDHSGSFDLIMKNYSLIEHKEFIGAGMTYSSSDYAPVFESYLFLDSKFETFSVRISRTEPMKENEYLYLVSEYDKVKEYILSRMEDGDIDFLTKITNGDDYFGRYIIKCACEAYIFHRCDAGISRFSLGTDGHIYHCSAGVGIPDFINDNLDKKINDKYQECSSCMMEHICGGECPVSLMNYSSRDICMCELKERMFVSALEICGTAYIYYPRLYQKLINHVEDVLLRQSADSRLKKLYPYIKKKYTFTVLKKLMYHDKEKFDGLYNKYIKR